MPVYNHSVLPTLAPGNHHHLVFVDLPPPDILFNYTVCGIWILASFYIIPKNVFN